MTDYATPGRPEDRAESAAWEAAKTRPDGLSATQPPPTAETPPTRHPSGGPENGSAAILAGRAGIPVEGPTPPYAGRDVLPQLDDPRVREMADRNHRPEEAWTLGGDCLVTCRQCAQPWPCPTRRAVDAMTKERP